MVRTGVISVITGFRSGVNQIFTLLAFYVE